MTTKQWFEETEQYVLDDALGERAWPQTLALTRVTDEGKSQSGWSRQDFMRNYTKGRFKPTRILNEFVEDGYPFGFIMRSVPLLCADLDGKNGGLQASSILKLPPTLAETSKSGTGYHLFYRVPEAVWHPEFGYDEFPDANGLLPGVDIRAIGIVYHYSQQRWNMHDIAPMPDTLRRLMQQKKEQQERDRERRDTPLEGEDLAIAREQALERLAKSIPAGKRNQTLFSIGCQLQLYQVTDWEDLLRARGDQLGLDGRELKSIIGHVKRYG